MFAIKKGLLFNAPESPFEVNEANALLYANSTISDLVYKDEDKDGVADWEERFWGLDPSQKETTPGIPDLTAANKIKLQQEYSLDEEGASPIPEEKLTETDKFSRELFSTVAALNGSGVMDESAIDKISTSLSQQLKNSTPRKIYISGDLNITNNLSPATYASNLNNLYIKNPITGSVPLILEEFIIDENNIDVTALKKLDPVVDQTNRLIASMVKMSVPSSLELEHLEAVNALERVSENVSDMRLYDTDPILALRGISEYEKNSSLLETAAMNLNAQIIKKMSN